MKPFDVTGPLPEGVAVLEASAGTGKTYTIAALAARYVAEGIDLDRLLLVTFTRMATGELRERVRERLVETEAGLTEVLEHGRLVEDRVVQHLASGSEPEVVVRRDRLTRAIADFDAATIATTHGFCQEVLGGLGVAGDVEPDAALVEDLTDLVEEVVDDLYIRRFHKHGNPDFDRAQALEIGRLAVANPATQLEPSDAPDKTVEAMRVRLAEAVRKEFDLRKRRLSVMTYDDLLVRLDDTLAGPGGTDAAERLRKRYGVVLVDEFQDTDPVQWDILERAFGTGGETTLVLIGDPKQAIYAFRGADVYAYLEAARTAGAQSTLNVNWRSDQGLIDAYDALMGGAQLGHPGIVYGQVRAADANQAPRLHGAPVSAPLRLRVAHRDEPSITKTRFGYASNASAREHIAKDLAADLVQLLGSGAEIEHRSQDGRELRREPILPGDVAVLVRTHRNAALIRDALEELSVPAVINGAGSVFGTEAASDWLRLLEAIERPTSPPRARAAALTPFVGWSTEAVASASDDDWEELHQRLHRWARVLRERGVASLSEAVSRAEGLPGRLLRIDGGERVLTDVRHLAQLLHTAATTEQMGAAALTAWLRARVRAALEETGDEERSRRLESDEDAVQVLTIHRSKGLEFPVVYYPGLWEPTWIAGGEHPIFFHDPAHGDRRTVDVGLGGPDWGRHVEQHELEQRGEDLRLAYVALTRAKHQAIVWWAGSANSRDSALGRLLFSKDEDGSIPPSGKSVPNDADALARMELLAETVPGCMSVELARVADVEPWAGVPRVDTALAVAPFDRFLDWRWRRTSFSDITAGAHEARVASEPEVGALSDEPAEPVPVVASEVAGPPSLLGSMPTGVRVGTFVHEVLEAVDFAAPELREEVDRVAARRAVDVGPVDEVVAGLEAMLATPLDPVLTGCLSDVARGDRLDELSFELPLVGGDSADGELTVAAIASVLRSGLGSDDVLAAYANRLEDPSLRPVVRGFLTGSIDVVIRQGDRYAIADYKTNWLGPRGEELLVGAYAPAAMAEEMVRAHYALQALLYQVALHRYLRWRVPGYSSGSLAGVLYLFVRGMVGAETPVVSGGRCGVFAWQPPGALVEALSDLFDRGSA